jgi:hypothetical protein
MKGTNWQGLRAVPADSPQGNGDFRLPMTENRILAQPHEVEAPDENMAQPGF